MGYVGPCRGRAPARVPAGGRELVGLDTGFFAHCLTGTSRPPGAAPRLPVLRRRPSRSGRGARGHRRGRPPRRRLERPDRHHLRGRRPSTSTTRATSRLRARPRRRAPRSFVFASSCSVYGLAEDGLRTEESETGPLTAYATSKLLAERRPGRARRRHLRRHEPAVRHRLRDDRPAAPRPRPERLRRRRPRLRQDHAAERRHAVAAAHPRARHGPRDRLGGRPAGRAARRSSR